MITEELEERLMQACAIIERLLDNPSDGLEVVARNFIEENAQDLNLLNPSQDV
ncbi:MAG: hypothetical protein JWR05_3505 [Mucilaginibacter sp.]|nr:hypothetical protein [Mucilaginibacter sp.]